MIRRILFLSVAMCSLALPLGYTVAGDCCPRTCKQGCHTCPNCHAVCCRLKVENDEVDEHCWNVECKYICVPRVVFPWQKSCCDPCVNNGACVKKIKVLKKEKYTCPTCKYSWTPVRKCCGHHGACGGYGDCCTGH